MHICLSVLNTNKFGLLYNRVLKVFGLSHFQKYDQTSYSFLEGLFIEAGKFSATLHTTVQINSLELIFHAKGYEYIRSHFLNHLNLQENKIKQKLMKNYSTHIKK